MLPSIFLRSTPLLIAIVVGVTTEQATAQFGDPCVKACFPNPGYGSSGGVPAGVSYTVIIGTPAPGLANIDCLTCDPCEQTVAVIFNGNGTGWCFQYAQGAGPFSYPPQQQYARAGKLNPVCKGSQEFTFEVVDCATGASVALHDVVTLNCDCTPG